MEKKKVKSRLHLIDEYRGFVVLNMIAYHAIWDMVYMFGENWKWYKSELGFIWQQWICWSFILVSGFCWQMGKNPFKRGMMVYAGGAIISLVTILAMPQSKVMFGILTFLGSAMVFMIPLDVFFRKFLFRSNPSILLSSERENEVCHAGITYPSAKVAEGKVSCCKIKASLGAIISFVLFLFTYRINRGYLGFDGHPVIVLPREWYANAFTTYLGFPELGFFSTDYFSIFPWMFLFLTGYFLYFIVLGNENADRMIELNKNRNYLKGCDRVLAISVCPPLGWIGRNALIIYMFHQPVIYGVLCVLYEI